MRLVYIAGEGRSGSTLLDRILGQVPGLISCGELHEIWYWGLERDALCSCGSHFSRCPFWTRVGEHAFGGWGSVSSAPLVAVVEALKRPGSVARLLARKRRMAGQFLNYAEATRALHRAIVEVGDGRVIVDSSKQPANAIALRETGAEITLVQLVRDSRGVAHSWARTVARTDVTGASLEMHRFTPARIAARWLERNLSCEILRVRTMSGALVRYEDLLARPRDGVKKILLAAGLARGPEDLTFIQSGEVVLPPTHMIMGNPMRMLTGSVPLRADEEWRRSMPHGARSLVTALTLPLLLRYRYVP